MRLAAAFVMAALVAAAASCGTGSDGDPQTPNCYIEDLATTCPGRITFVCWFGATPQTNIPCAPPVENRESQETLYCCGP
jgi:hypothetical protein